MSLARRGQAISTKRTAPNGHSLGFCAHRPFLLLRYWLYWGFFDWVLFRRRVPSWSWSWVCSRKPTVAFGCQKSMATWGGLLREDCFRSGIEPEKEEWSPPCLDGVGGIDLLEFFVTLLAKDFPWWSDCGWSKAPHGRAQRGSRRKSGAFCRPSNDPAETNNGGRANLRFFFAQPLFIFLGKSLENHRRARGTKCARRWWRPRSAISPISLEIKHRRP